MKTYHDECRRQTAEITRLPDLGHQRLSNLARLAAAVDTVEHKLEGAVRLRAILIDMEP